jgi:hypothetical protein
MGSASFSFPLIFDSYPFDAQGNKLPVHVLAFETASYSLVVEVIFVRTKQAYLNWQIRTFDKLVNAYRESVQKYEAKVEELKAVAEAEAARTTFASVLLPPKT